jgi:hypothetical protein
MPAPFIPTEKNSTCDGNEWPEALDMGFGWDDLQWHDATWEEHSIWGADPHWRVPHKDGDTFHRVRKLDD